MVFQLLNNSDKGAQLPVSKLLVAYEAADVAQKGCWWDKLYLHIGTDYLCPGSMARCAVLVLECYSCTAMEATGPWQMQ